MARTLAPADWEFTLWSVCFWFSLSIGLFAQKQPSMCTTLAVVPSPPPSVSRTLVFPRLLSVFVFKSKPKHSSTEAPRQLHNKCTLFRKQNLKHGAYGEARGVGIMEEVGGRLQIIGFPLGSPRRRRHAVSTSAPIPFLGIDSFPMETIRTWSP